MRSSAPFSSRSLYWAAPFMLAALVFALLLNVPRAAAISPNVVISQVYGGGGNSGAPYRFDYVELFNRGSAPASIAGWSIQYASATGNGLFGAAANVITVLPNVTLQPGQYYLIQEAGGAVGVALPTPDSVDATPIAMAATAGKVALVSSTAPLGCNGSSTTCTPAQLALIVDLIGYGNANFYEGAAAPVLSNTTAALRASNGCTDTDSNAADFTAGAPAPRNTATPLAPCSGPPNIVISQVFGGGGNSGAPYANDFIELFNRGSAPASLAGWSIQYASATGTGNFGANSALITLLPNNVTLQPGQYFLIQQVSEGAGGALPAPDLVGVPPIYMDSVAGKVALVSGITSLGCNGGSIPCSPAQTALIIDLVGYGTANFYEGAGAAPGLSFTTAALRKTNGCTETNNNGADFTAGAPVPRNTASPLYRCDALPPVALNLQIDPVPGLVSTPITVTARISDALSGSSVITAAQLSLDNFATWLPMQPADGLFDSPVEDVRASFTPPNLDPGTVCVRGFDVRANVSAPVCTPYSVSFIPGQITVTKQVDVAASGSFQFDWTSEFTVPPVSTISPSGSFALDGSGPGATDVIANAVPGARHVITESLPDGWLFDGAICTDASGADTPLEVGPGARIAFTYTDIGGYTCLWNNLGPALVVTKTVGLGDGCGTDKSLGVLEGTLVTYCFTARNNGATTLTTHTVNDTVLGLILNNEAFDLLPGATAVLTRTHVPLETETNTVTWQGSVGLTSVSDSDGATVSVIPLAPGITVSKGVGVDPAACATATTLFTDPGTPVYYCYSVTNTGNVTLTNHTLVDDQLGTLLNDAVYSLAPGATVTTRDLNLTISASPIVTTTNAMTWTASLPNRALVEASASATVNIIPPAIALVKTVGLDPATCATTDTLEVIGPTVVYYCYTVTNTGSLTLTEHSLVDSDLGALLSDFSYSLQPGAGVSTVAAGLTISRSLAITTTNTATWTAVLPERGEASATAEATVLVVPLPPPAPVISLQLSVGLNPAVCGVGSAILVEEGTTVYYCYTVTNTGEAPLFMHRLVDEDAGLVLDGVAFALAPGRSFSTVDAGRVISAVITSGVSHGGTWTAFDAQQVAATAAAEVTVRVGVAMLEVSKVAATTDTCTGSSNLGVETGGAIYFCIQLTNTGDFTFTRFLVSDPLVGLEGTIALTLPPGAATTFSDDQFPALGPVLVTQTMTNTAWVTASNPSNIDELAAGWDSVDAAAVAPTTSTSSAFATVRVIAPTADHPVDEPGRGALYFLPWVSR